MSIQNQIREALPSSVIWDKGEDHSVKGLHVRVTAKGAKAFYLFYRTKTGTQRRPKIGDVGSEINLTTARQIAREWWKEIARGGDPSWERLHKRTEPTVGELYETALAEHWGKAKYALSGWKREVEGNWKNHLEATFSHVKVSDLTAPMVHEWHRKYETNPYAGNRSKAVLSKMLAIAETKGWRNPQSNPCASVPNHPEVSRERFATDDEIRRIVTIMEREAKNNPAAIAFLYLLMFTGARPRSIERATWDQLQYTTDVGVLTFDGKTGREVVVIPERVMLLIDLLPRNTKTITGIKMPRTLWERIRKEAGCEDLWARDWRRTFASVGLSSGVGLDQIGRALNHRTTQTTLTYAKLQNQARIDTTNQIAGRIEKIIKP